MDYVGMGGPKGSGFSAVLVINGVRSHNRGRRPEERAIFSIGVVPMIWENNSIFRTNCAIACGTRAYMLRGFLRMSRGEMASEIPEIFHVFGPQFNAFTCVGILLKYFRGKLPQFEGSKTMSNLGMFRCKLIYIADQVVFRRMLLLHELYINPL